MHRARGARHPRSSRPRTAPARALSRRCRTGCSAPRCGCGAPGTRPWSCPRARRLRPQWWSRLRGRLRLRELRVSGERSSDSSLSGPPCAAARPEDSAPLKRGAEIAERSLKSLQGRRFPLFLLATVVRSRGAMDFRILGPLEVEADGQVLPIGSRQPRALLTILLLDANRVVSRDRLMEALWGDDPPERATNALQVYVSQLRKALGADVIVTQPRGYLVHVADGELDLERFESLVAESRPLEPAAAARLLREELSLWRGAPLPHPADLPPLAGDPPR